MARVCVEAAVARVCVEAEHRRRQISRVKTLARFLERGQACVCVAGPSMCVCGRVKRVCVWPGFAAGRAGARGARAQRLGGICTRRETGASKRQG